MRANRLYGSEGGGADIRSPYPYQDLPFYPYPFESEALLASD